MFVSFRLGSKRSIIAVALVICLCVSIPIIVLASASQPPKTVYLTFDDGPSFVTPRLLETLKEHDVKATFFVSGQYEEYFPVLKQIVDDGHLIALHTYSHEFREIYASTDAFWSDIDKIDTLVYEYAGVRAARIIRFPGGSSNTVSYRYGGSEIMSTLVEQCAEREFAYFDWTIDTQDAIGAKSASYITNKVINNIDNVPIAVVLMHDGPQQKTAADATAQIIVQLKEMGYVFDTLDHVTEEVHHTIP